MVHERRLDCAGSFAVRKRKGLCAGFQRFQRRIFQGLNGFVSLRWLACGVEVGETIAALLLRDDRALLIFHVNRQHELRRVRAPGREVVADMSIADMYDDATVFIAGNDVKSRRSLQKR